MEPGALHAPACPRPGKPAGRVGKCRTMNALEIKQLSKSFGGLQVLRGASLSMEVGERVAIIGPNGAGKTTFLSIITGAQRPTGGQITLFGCDVTNMPPQERTTAGWGAPSKSTIFSTT